MVGVSHSTYSYVANALKVIRRISLELEPLGYQNNSLGPIELTDHLAMRLPRIRTLFMAFIFTGLILYATFVTEVFNLNDLVGTSPASSQGKGPQSSLKGLRSPAPRGASPPGSGLSTPSKRGPPGIKNTLNSDASVDDVNNDKPSDTHSSGGSQSIGSGRDVEIKTGTKEVSPAAVSGTSGSGVANPIDPTADPDNSTTELQESTTTLSPVSPPSEASVQTNAIPVREDSTPPAARPQDSSKPEKTFSVAMEESSSSSTISSSDTGGRRPQDATSSDGKGTEEQASFSCDDLDDGSDDMNFLRPVSRIYPYNSDSCESVDVVITWVDGQDPGFQRDLHRYVTKNTEYLERNTDFTGYAANRFRDFGQLRYNLRSIARNAPWIRKVFIVSGTPAPNWLNVSYPRVEFVPHSAIFPEWALPQMSSNSIQAHLHLIPGLSDRFLQMDDDQFFNQPTNRDNFIREDGSFNVYFAWGSKSGEDDPPPGEPSLDKEEEERLRSDIRMDIDSTEGEDHDNDEELAPLSDVTIRDEDEMPPEDEEPSEVVEIPSRVVREHDDGEEVEVVLRNGLAPGVSFDKSRRAKNQDNPDTRKGRHAAVLTEGDPEGAQQGDDQGRTSVGDGDGDGDDEHPGDTEQDERAAFDRVAMRRLLGAWGEALSYTNRLFDKAFGWQQQRLTTQHGPNLVDKWVMREMHGRFPNEIANLVSHKVRHHNDIEPIFAYSHFVLEQKNFNLSLHLENPKDPIVSFGDVKNLLCRIKGSCPMRREVDTFICKLQRLCASPELRVDQLSKCPFLVTSMQHALYRGHAMEDESAFLGMERVDQVEDFFEKLRTQKQLFACINDDLDVDKPDLDVIARAKELLDEMFPERSLFERRPQDVKKRKYHLRGLDNY